MTNAFELPPWAAAAIFTETTTGSGASVKTVLVTDLSEPHQLTRADLYRKIWETPLIGVAADYGVTNFLLSALCRHHAIPTPSAGHWSKLAHCKPTNQPIQTGDHEQILTIASLQRPGFRPSRPTSLAERRAKTVEAPIAERAPIAAVTHPKLQKTFMRLRKQTGSGLRHVAGAGCFTVKVVNGLRKRDPIVTAVNH